MNFSIGTVIEKVVYSWVRVYKATITSKSKEGGQQKKQMSEHKELMGNLKKEYMPIINKKCRQSATEELLSRKQKF